jgi:hypothetical protein
MVVLRTMLRKNTTIFAKLQNGKFGLRVWYPNLKATKEASSGDATEESTEEETETETTEGKGSATAKKSVA